MKLSIIINKIINPDKDFKLCYQLPKNIIKI